jgi:hypothetical protein
MVTSRALNRVGVLAMVLPLCTWLLVEFLSRVIPDCHVRMYGENECFVAGFNLGPSLLLAGFGGVLLFFFLTAFVALPLFLLAAFFSWRAKRRSSSAA